MIVVLFSNCNGINSCPRFFYKNILPKNSRRFLIFFFHRKGHNFSESTYTTFDIMKVQGRYMTQAVDSGYCQFGYYFLAFFLSAYFVTKPAKWKMLIANKIYRGMSNFSH